MNYFSGYNREKGRFYPWKTQPKIIAEQPEQLVRGFETRDHQKIQYRVEKRENWKGNQVELFIKPLLKSVGQMEKNPYCLGDFVWQCAHKGR